MSDVFARCGVKLSVTFLGNAFFGHFLRSAMLATILKLLSKKTFVLLWMYMQNEKR